MSFRCEGCKSVAHKPKIVTTKSRMHEHVELRPGEFGELEPTIIGSGPQIVQQKMLCSSCA
jgi:hypothetical protein